MGAIFGDFVETKIADRLVANVGHVDENDDFVELQAAAEQVLGFGVIDRWRIRTDAGIEEFDLVRALLAREIKHAGEGILERQSYSFGKRVAHQKNAPTLRFQRNIAHCGIL